MGPVSAVLHRQYPFEGLFLKIGLVKMIWRVLVQDLANRVEETKSLGSTRSSDWWTAMTIKAAQNIQPRKFRSLSWARVIGYRVRSA